MRQQLFQVSVEDADTSSMILVGPAMIEQHTMRLAQAIADQIAKGAEKRWSNPTVVRAITLN